MNIDTDLITAQEFEWVLNNEPTFQVQDNSFVGKVGRTPTGEDIRIRITLPKEFYPIVKPEVKVLNNISHPNIDSQGNLALQLLDEWEPRYRVKDIISAARRLFIKSKKMIKQSGTAQKVVIDDKSQQLRDEIARLQEEIASYTQKITQLKVEKLHDAGVKTRLSSAVPISAKAELKAKHLAIMDLLGLIETKFEEAEMDEIAFFRLYRKYTKENYIILKQLEGGQKNELPKQKAERPIGI